MAILNAIIVSHSAHLTCTNPTGLSTWRPTFLLCNIWLADAVTHHTRSFPIKQFKTILQQKFIATCQDKFKIEPNPIFSRHSYYNLTLHSDVDTIMWLLPNLLFEILSDEVIQRDIHYLVSLIWPNKGSVNRDSGVSLLSLWIQIKL